MSDVPEIQPCPICSQLSEQEYAYQKYGSEQNNTYLPSATAQLILMKDFDPYSSRKKQLWQCSICATYYFYRTDYEYLVNGSEDEEILSRLSAQQAAQYLVI
jgi:hypothetical protein